MTTRRATLTMLTNTEIWTWLCARLGSPGQRAHARCLSKAAGIQAPGARLVDVRQSAWKRLRY